MVQMTIATRSRPRPLAQPGSSRAPRFAAGLLTGPGAFLLAGAIDLLAAVWWLLRHRRAWPEP